MPQNGTTTTHQGKTLPYDLVQLSEELKRKAKAELFEDDAARGSSLQSLKTMITGEVGLDAQTDDWFLLAFLRARKFDVKRAFSLMRNFYKAMGKHPELYQDIDMADVDRTLEECRVGILPMRDREGSTILLVSCKGWEPQHHSFGDVMRALTVSIVHAVRYPATQVAGFKVIFDFAGFSARHLPHVSPSYMWLLAEALQNCFPGRFRAVHVVNESFLFGPIWSVLKQLLSKKISNRFHFHGQKMPHLLQHFPPSCLPGDYGGCLPPFDNAPFRKQLLQDSDFITEVFQYGFRNHR